MDFKIILHSCCLQEGEVPIENLCINVQVMARTITIYDHFDIYLTPMTLSFNLPEKNVSNGTSPP